MSSSSRRDRVELTGSSYMIIKVEDVLVHRGHPRDEKWTPINGAAKFFETVPPNRRVVYSTGSATVSEIARRLGQVGIHIVEDDIVIADQGVEDAVVRAAAKMRTKPHTCVVIENSASGIHDAREAGVTRVIALRTGHASDSELGRADFLVEDFRSIERERRGIFLADATPGLGHTPDHGGPDLGPQL